MRKLLIAVSLGLPLWVIGGFAAGAAEATEGPFYKHEGTRLEVKEAQKITSKGLTAFVLKSASTGIAIMCTSEELKGAELLGSKGANPGTAKEIMSLQGCEVAGDGPGCSKVRSLSAPAGTIETYPLKAKLAYQEERKGKIYVFLAPVEEASGFALLFFEGGKCTSEATVLEGSTDCEVWSEGKAVVVGAEQPAAKSGEINCPATGNDFFETEGVLQGLKPQLSAFGRIATFTGRSEVKLESGEKWCIGTEAKGSKC